MAEGDPVPDGEFWYRVLVRLEFLGDGGRISEGALKDNAIRTNRSAARDWRHEVSGRRSSLAGDARDVDAHAVAFVEKRQDDRKARRQPRDDLLCYSGIASANARDLRGDVTPAIRAEVIHTPIDGTDEAHSDFVTFDSTKPDKDEIITWLQDRLKISLPGSGHPFQATPPSTTASTETTTNIKPTDF